MARFSFVFALLVVAAACGANEESSALPPVPTASSSPYSIHEWGLLHFGLNEPLGMATAGPGHFPRSIHVESDSYEEPAVAYKPVLYVHLTQPTAQFRAQIRAPGGSIVEHWPAGERASDAVAWADVRATQGACTGLSYPSIFDERCQGPELDGFCELAELGTYETNDGACLQVGGAQANNLFYRAFIPHRAPLAVSMDGDVAVVRHQNGAAVPGKLIRVRRQRRGRWLHVATVDPPAPGASVRIDRPTEEGDLMVTLDRHLRELGLTESERSAFDRAWRVDLVGGPRQPSLQGARQSQPPTLPAPDALYYWLAPEHANAMLPLSFDPPPREVKRGLLVRVHLAPARSASAQPMPPFEIRGVRVVSGNIARARANESVYFQRSALRACTRQQPAAGVVEFELSLNGQGAVANVRFRSTNDAVNAVHSCFETALRRVRLRPDEGPFEPSVVRGRVVFNPSLN
ncbi:MAG: hypothetical protein AAF411_26715 [Myxococcota bacterium]